MNKFPVEQYEKYIKNTIKNFKKVIVAGETGCGKTIFIPKILYKQNFLKKILISQTKRIAVIKAACYISKILKVKLGHEIGYTVRFDHKLNKNTKIKFVTDGILFKELLEDVFLDQYDCIIIDEFHERTVYTDLLLSNLKNILNIRKKNLLLIIMSASGEYKKIANFFTPNVGKINIPGRLFNIKIFYTRIPQSNYIISIVAFIIEIHIKLKKISGDFLIFLPGKEEIRTIYNMFKYIILKDCHRFIIIELYANKSNEGYFYLTNDISQRVRKIFIATNVAESSITIPTINIVIDSGLAKKKTYNWKNGVNLFRIFPISKSEVYQRTGRTGRKNSGKCFRMFTFDDFYKFSCYPKPTIEQTDLTLIILQLYSSQSICILNLDFITIPSTWNIYKSIEKLFVFGAISNKLQINMLGKVYSIFPLDISLSITIIESIKKNKITSDVINTAVSILATDIPFFEINTVRINENYNKIKTIGDHFYHVMIFYEHQLKKNNKNKSIFSDYLNFMILIKKQIKETCFIVNPLISTNFFSNKKTYSPVDQFKFCFTAGYFLNTSRLLSKTCIYQIVSTSLFAKLHPFSLYKKEFPKLIIFYEFSINYKQVIKGIMPIKLEWAYFFGKKIFI